MIQADPKNLSTTAARPGLRLAGRDAQGAVAPARFDSIRFAERALEQAENRMRNIRELAERFGLDIDGDDSPRAA